MSKRYIAILRGINVGGKRIILMKDLKKVFLRMGFANVETYIQSGNILFSLPLLDHKNTLVKTIEKAIYEEFGFEVPVIILTSEELSQSILDNPFLEQENCSVDNLYATFLGEKPNAEALEIIKKFDASPDNFVISEKIVFVYCSGKYHQSKLTNGFFEKKLKVSATTRNLKTVLKLQSLLLKGTL